MADAKRKQYPLITSPKGVFKYPKLTKIDYGTDKFPKPDGEHSVTLILAKDDAATVAFLAKLAPLYDEAVTEAKAKFSELEVKSRKVLEKKNAAGGGLSLNDMFTEVYDKETEEPTGDIEFKFKMKAGGISKKEKEISEREGRQPKRWSRKPGMFDAVAKSLPKGVDIWGGTIGKISFTAEPYFIPGTGAVGLGLKLEAVQVLTLVASGSKTAEQYGFGQEEGYEGTDEDLPEQSEANPPANDGDGKADDGNF